MTITIDNPYYVKIVEKIKEEDKMPASDKEGHALIAKEIAELRQQSNDFVHAKLDEIQSKVEEIKAEKIEVENTTVDTKKDYKATSKRISILYKDAVQLFLSLRELRKQFKENFKEK